MLQVDPTRPQPKTDQEMIGAFNYAGTQGAPIRTGLATAGGATALRALSGTSVAPGGSFWMNPITQDIVKGTAATTAVNTAMVGTTGKTWGEGVEELTGIPSWIGEFTNPGGGVAFSRGYNMPGAQQVFENLPYKTFGKVRGVAKRTKAALNGRTDMQQLRYKASSRPIKGVQSEGTYQTTTKNPVELLRKRIQYKQDNAGIYEMPPEVSTIDNTPTYGYTPLRDIYKMVREDEKVLPSLLITPFAYWKINSAPGMFIRTKTPYVQLNPKIFKSYFGNVNPDIATAHELAHALWNRHQLIGFGKRDIYGFNFNGLPKRVQQYFNDNEIAARGTQLKNYFGITDNTPLTGDMLKYAANNYVRDTGLNNNMNQFFRSITDWDNAARWLSSYSYKKGGKI